MADWAKCVALCSEHPDVLKSLLNGNLCFERPLALICEVVKANHSELSVALLDHCLVRLQSNEVVKLARLAARHVDGRISMFLLERGVPFDLLVLSSALKNGNQKLISMLAEAGLRGKLMDIHAMLELALRSKNNAGHLLQMLLDKCQPAWISAAVCLTAARYGNCEAMRRFLSLGANVNTRDPRSGRSLCHEAA
jgi:hypothetical protein